MGIDFILDELDDLQNRSLLREHKIIEGAQGPYVHINGKSYLSFCSNNYLGLANHPKIKQASIDAIHQYGWGAGASRLVSGTMTLHQELEKKIAEFKGTEAALLFPTGYMANLGALCALVSRGDMVIGDKLNHASIIDGCRLSGATFRIYPHKDVSQLESLLQRSSGYRRKLVITDSVFSMDGDTAPIPEIVNIARKYDAMLMVDDAHATGVFGKQGKGLIEHYGLEGKIDVVMGSFSKALGSVGGFIAGSKPLIDFLKNKARPFIYTTALPPAVCAASLAGLALIQEDASLIDSLWRNIASLKTRLLQFMRTISVESPIVPLIAGSAEDAVKVSSKLYENGILIPAIRPPTVPPGTSRLRISLMATHSENDINRLIETLQHVGFLTHERTTLRM
ncbi:MAG: 8-amino-7-oxononanoate synthase [Candidatus Brocadia carolinensis]|uniref:8-amino-7-oxononanoate synthase n=1 Tax=Candidatus Brocadia carolinensis TaxID=1004156 RepID=A0A1V4AQP6_9BACT|nr:MAG: 8-amino-7-oxononanoate synthase [Candidatus Brocadia caroliniensis]